VRSSRLRVREATREDAEAVAKLHAESWRSAYRGAYRDEFLDGDVFVERAEVWRERLCEPSSSQFVLIAEDAGQLAGLACAYGGEDPQWGTLLDNLHVSCALQRQVLGARLVCRVGGWCRGQVPDCGLYLWVSRRTTARVPSMSAWGPRIAAEPDSTRRVEARSSLGAMPGLRSPRSQRLVLKRAKAPLDRGAHAGSDLGTRRLGSGGLRP
jgi:hypothetical protein